MISSEEITTFCDDAMDEVTDLRFKELNVGPHSAPSLVAEELWDVRVRLDRTEELLLQMYRLKEKLKRAHTANKAIYEDKWDLESRKTSTNITSRMNDYSSARERAAEINLKLLNEKRAERQSEEIYSIVNGAYQYIKMTHEGLDKIKQDLQSIIRVFQIESSIGGRR